MRQQLHPVGKQSGLRAAMAMAAGYAIDSEPRKVMYNLADISTRGRMGARGFVWRD